MNPGGKGMTNEEALSVLSKIIINPQVRLENPEVVDAIEMAKKALKKKEWIPCSVKMPEEPKLNDNFGGKALEIYLVCKRGNIPFRAFWDGKRFTDGFTTLMVDAWQPMPQSYDPDNNVGKIGE